MLPDNNISSLDFDELLLLFHRTAICKIVGPHSRAFPNKYDIKKGTSQLPLLNIVIELLKGYSIT